VFSTFSRTASRAKEVRSALAHVSQAIQGMNFGAVEASNEGSCSADFGPAALHPVTLSFAVLVTEGALNVDPLAFVPHTALHLAALGHLQAVKRVTVTAEKTSNKVILATQLATLEIKLLPPILMIAMLQSQVEEGRCFTFTRSGTLSRGNIVQCITSTLTLKSSQQEIVLAGRPAPLIK
jgi:hypothetical protein